MDQKGLVVKFVTVAGIISQLQKELADILANQPILLAYLYGSQARSEATALSDVDIALVTDKNLPALARLDLEFKIEEALAYRGIANPDVRIINQAPLSVRGRVITEGVLLYYQNKDLLTNFEAQTRVQYRALQPIIYEQRQTYFQRAIEELRARGYYDR